MLLLIQGMAMDAGWSPATFWLNASTPWMYSVERSAAGRAACTLLRTDTWTVHSFAAPSPLPGQAGGGIGVDASGQARFALQGFSKLGNDADVGIALALPIVVAPVGSSWNQLAGLSVSAPPPAPRPPPPPPPPAPPPPPPAPTVFRCVNSTCVPPLPGRPGVAKATCELDCG